MAKERLKSPRARLFVALDLPHDVRAGLVDWQRTALSDPALRVVRPEALHMTLVFLGYQAEKDAKAIAKAALRRRRRGARRRARPGSRSACRPASARRLIALAANSDETVALQRQVEERLVEGGFYEPEKRPFWPHLTMARVKPEVPKSRKPALITTPPHPLPEHMFRFFRPTRLVLFKSHLRRSGAEYEPLAELELPTANDDQETER